MRMTFFRDQFQNFLVTQRGLLRLRQPRFPQRLQTREVVGRHRVSRQQRRVQRELRPRGGVHRTRHGKIFRTLKGANRRARLQTHRRVQRTRRNSAPRQRHLRLKHIVEWPRKVRRFFRRYHERWRWICRQQHGWRRWLHQWLVWRRRFDDWLADDYWRGSFGSGDRLVSGNFFRMFLMPPEPAQPRNDEEQQQHGQKISAPATAVG